MHIIWLKRKEGRGPPYLVSLSGLFAEKEGEAVQVLLSSPYRTERDQTGLYQNVDCAEVLLIDFHFY